MEFIRTIRNCPPQFRVVCPQKWENLSPTNDENVRHCEKCDQKVYLCQSDEETIAHARAGHCIARALPSEENLPVLYLGQPEHVPRTTPAQREAEQILYREHGINDAIRNSRTATRSCPECNYPMLDWRVTCRVCGHVLGRVTRDEG